MIDIILLQPRKQENLGSIARVMKNFGFQDLVLIEPKCLIGKKAKSVARHGSPILENIKFKKISSLNKYDCLIGTTSKFGSDNNLLRNAISVKELSSKVILANKHGLKIGILFGRENIGLKNDEIEMCDIVTTIPSSMTYPALNLSHATAIILYELSGYMLNEKSNHRINLASKKDISIIMKYVNGILDKLNFHTKEKKKIQKISWKRIFGKAFLTKKESYTAMSLFRKILKELK
jgi:tRNA/rRNA methyltransferase